MRTLHRPRLLFTGGLVVSLLLVSACTGSTGSLNNEPSASNTGGATGAGSTMGAAAGAASAGSDTGGAADVPFQPLPPGVYGAKVKNLLTGQPLTDADYTALTADPGKLPSMIDTWMAEPAWHDRMLIFFKQAFQQTQSTLDDYVDVFNGDSVVTSLGSTPFLRVMEEMFPRTVLDLIDEGRPFTEVVTTNRFMMTPAIMSSLAYIDTTPQTDGGTYEKAAWSVLNQNPTFSVSLVPSPMIPSMESVDSTSPNFMHWFDATPSNYMGTKCANPITYTKEAAVKQLFSYLFGHRPGCRAQITPVFTDADWNTWRMVTVRPPHAGETQTAFWDISKLRTANELVLQTPRVGFMTTPAFFANWPTNTSNQARVTTNQTMIVALGLAFDDRGVTVSVQSSAGDTAHAQPGTVCYGCHQTLDPMRDFFRQSYTYFYDLRVPDKKNDVIPARGVFTVGGSPPVTGQGIGDLAKAVVSHPRFPIAWAQKVCRFANSVSCSESDPEFQRIVGVFQSGGFQFKTLMREMLSSPLVTFASATKTASTMNVSVSIDRRDSLCTSLSNRLGIPDLCGLYGTQKKTALPVILATAVPSDAYARGAEEPMMPTNPNLFFVSATENLCALLATQLVDVKSSQPSRYTNAQKDAAFDDFVATVMGVPKVDPRASKLRAVLAKHYDAAIASGQQATDALRSTFILACSSPLAVTSGL